MTLSGTNFVRETVIDKKEPPVQTPPDGGRVDDEFDFCMKTRGESPNAFGAHRSRGGRKGSIILVPLPAFVPHSASGLIFGTLLLDSGRGERPLGGEEKS